MPHIDQIAYEITTEQLRYFDDISTYLEIDVSSEKTLVCQSPCNNSRVKFSWSYTPLIWWITPNNLYYGLKSYTYLNTRNAPNYKSATQMAVDIRLDGTSLDMESDLGIDDNYGTNSNVVIDGFVMSEDRNMTLDYKVRFRGAGYGLEHGYTSINCNWDATDCYSARLHPSINELSASSGYMNGGQELIIYGHGLDPYEGETLSVTVDGVDCAVKFSNKTQIMCITGEKIEDPDFVAPNLYVGGHGVNRHFVNNTSGVN